MATARPTLAAAHREVTGKAVSRMRKDGRLPAVVFGHGMASANVSLDTHDFEQLRRHTGPNALIELSVDGEKSKPVLVQHVQVHPVNRRLLHVDLFAVRMTEELTVEVQLVGTGSAPATELGGTLVHPVSSVRVRALPDKLPESLYYDLASLVDYDSTITVADLVVPDGVAVQAEASEVIARVLAPRVEEVTAEAAEAAEAAEVAEGAEGAAESEAASEG
jgi:large subunit ribosomal protein L25